MPPPLIKATGVVTGTTRAAKNLVSPQAAHSRGITMEVAVIRIHQRSLSSAQRDGVETLLAVSVM